MTAIVPLVSDPRDQLLGELPFVNTRAFLKCQAAIRQAFDDAAGEKENVQVMLHLNTRNGNTLLEMVANIVRSESDVVVILTGRQIDSNLAGLLHHNDQEGSVSEADLAGVLHVNNGFEMGSQLESSSVSSITMGTSMESIDVPALATEPLEGAVWFG